MSNVQSNRNSRETLPRLKPLSHAVLCALYSLTPLPVLALDSHALPVNGQVVAGSASINSNSNVMTVNQGSDRMIATWNTFNIGSDARVHFQQPGSSSVALNRVVGSDGSQILGQLSANGQVYLINPSGVLFGAGSMVSVGGLVASSLDISNSDFMAGRQVFAGKSLGEVINQGTITAGDGGSVALLGAQVRNEGTVIARLGSVVLGAGEKTTLDLNGDGLINLEVNDPAVGASVANKGLLRATGGWVTLSARDSQAMLSNVVNNEGVIEARSLQQRNGRVVLDGGSTGVVVNSGTLDVSGRNSSESGGNVSMTGEYVGLFDRGQINAEGNVGGGTVLLGGDYQGRGDVHQATSSYMGSDARISADALSNGNGGKVILWSLDSTQFHGGISVKGAGSQGRGGLVETSGHALEVTGVVDLSAVSGNGGTWLIDPFNINITQGASSGATSTSPFTSRGAASSTLSSATLNASLSEGANVLVCTSSAGGTSGDINVLSNVRALGNATLTLQAHRNIVITNTSISNATDKALNVSLYSNYNNTANGSVALSNATISTNGGNLTISGAVQPSQSWAITNLSNGSGISLSNGTRLTTSGGNVNLRGATSLTLAAGASATGVSINGSSIDAGGGNISITALQASIGGVGDAFTLTGGSRLFTTGLGSITVDSTSLGSGNGIRIYSTNNSIAATGSGNVTLRGNATSGAGVLVCSTAAASSQSLSVGTGTLTVQGNGNGFAGAGRGVNFAASADGSVNLSAAQGGAIVLDGSSTSSYGTILNSSGALSSIRLTTRGGNLTVSGTATGGTTPALALVTSGNGTATAPGAGINITSSSGDVRLKANQNTVSTSSGSFRGLSLDAGGDYSAIRIATQSGDLTLDGSSVSGRGVDIAPSGGNASISLATTSGDIHINGNSTAYVAGYGIFFNSTGNSQGVNVSSGSGNITLRGNSAGASDAVVLGGSSGNQVSTQGGDVTLMGVVQPSQSSTSTNLSNGNGISLGTGTLIVTHGGNVNLSGATSSTLASGTSATGVSVRGSSIDAGGGNISITALQASIGGVGDAFTLTGGSRLFTTGLGSITVDSTSLGSGNGIRIYSTNNSIAATGSGNVTLRGNATSGAGVLVCSTAAASSQSLSLGTGTLTVQGNGNGFAGAGRGVNFAASADGAINLSSALGGAIALDGSSTRSYGTILNSTGATSSIKLTTDGNIRLAGTTAGGSASALALVTSGSGTVTTPGASINIASSGGDVLLKASHNTLSTASGSFKALSLDAGGDYSAIRIATQSGDLTLDGSSVSGRGVDIAPSGANAAISLATTSGDINISGNSTMPFGGYGIFFNSTGNSQGVNVSSGSGNITLRGDSLGTSDAIALGGSTGNGVSSNWITSQGGDITLIGNFHSPNSGELDHGIAILSVNNILQTHGDGNLTLAGNALGLGSGIEVYGNGKAQLSVENGALSITGSSGAGDGIGLLTGQNLIQATGSGSITLKGQSGGGSGINIYPSGTGNSLTLSTVSGDLSLTGISASTSSEAGLRIRSGGTGAANGVRILSSSGDIRLTGIAQGNGDGIAFGAASPSGYNRVATGGNLTLTGRSVGGAALSFDDGNNNLQVSDSLLWVDVDTPTGHYITHTDDVTSLSASGRGAVVISRGELIDSSPLDSAGALTTQHLQMQMAHSDWSQPLASDYHLTALGRIADQVNIDVAQWRYVSDTGTAAPRSSSKIERE